MILMFGVLLRLFVELVLIAMGTFQFQSKFICFYASKMQFSLMSLRRWRCVTDETICSNPNEISDSHIGDAF